MFESPDGILAINKKYSSDLYKRASESACVSVAEVKVEKIRTAAGRWSIVGEPCSCLKNDTCCLLVGVMLSPKLLG